jgi:hypothetical protein
MITNEDKMKIYKQNLTGMSYIITTYTEKVNKLQQEKNTTSMNFGNKLDQFERRVQTLGETVERKADKGPLQ